MGIITYGIIGTGWRSDFYRRIAELAPETFALAATYTRTAEKAKDLARTHREPVVSDWEAFVALPMDFVVVSVQRGQFVPYLKALAAKNLPALCETPPAETVEELNALWAFSKRSNTKIQVAEQYFLQPLYAAWLNAIHLELLGKVHNINLSALHGYHAASIFRKVLGVGMQPFTAVGQGFIFPVVNTLSRDGADRSGILVDATRGRVTIVFESGKTAFFDFSDIQYHSTIRTRQLTIQGTRGEIDDLTIRYLRPDNDAVFQTLNRVDLGIYNNQEWSHQGMWLGELSLFKSPLPCARLNDDELAVASCLLGMADYVKTGKDFYSLREALQDTYLSLLIDAAVANPGVTLKSEVQSWQG